MAKRFLVIGLGRYGMALASSLAEQGAEVIAADRDLTLVEELRDRVSLAVELDATDPRTLRSLEAERVEAAIVAIGEDFEAAVLTIAALKEVGVKRIIARARQPREARILSVIGANEVILIEPEMGRTVGQRLIAGQAASGEPLPKPHA